MLDEFTCVDCGVGRWLLFRFLNNYIGLFLRSIRIYKWPHELSRWPVANKTGCFDIEVICFIVELWKCPFLLLIMLLWFFISITNYLYCFNITQISCSYIDLFIEAHFIIILRKRSWLLSCFPVLFFCLATVE